MREIKFRGQQEDKKWRYGSLITYPNGATDIELYDNGWKKICSVECETIGQYTGLKDKNGKEIFEGDIINTTVLGIDHTIIVEVKFIHGCFGFFTTKRKVYEAGAVLPVFAVLAPGVNVEVIGNIYDNQELLEGD